MSSNLTFKEILVNLGFTPTDIGNELRMRPIYRDSDNNTSLKVDKQTGSWIDFGVSKGGSFEELVQLTLGLGSLEDAKNFLNTKFQFVPNTVKVKPKIKVNKYFDIEILKGFEPDHSYWKGRRISEETASFFKGGVCKSGRMKNRYCIPIFDLQGKILGLTGRTLVNSSIKWKHLGDKSSWCYPVYFNNNELQKEKKVILLESPACVFALWDVNIKNTICLFGVSCSLTILNFLIKLDPNKIIIALNNEPDNNNIGNQAAEKLYNKLIRYFDSYQIIKALPPKKDFAVMEKEERTKWYASL